MRHFLKTLMEGAKADTSLVLDQADGSDDDGSSAVGTQDDRDQPYRCITGYSRKTPECYFFQFRFPATLARSHTTPEP